MLKYNYTFRKNMHPLPLRQSFNTKINGRLIHSGSPYNRYTLSQCKEVCMWCTRVTDIMCRKRPTHSGRPK